MVKIFNLNNKIYNINSHKAHMSTMGNINTFKVQAQRDSREFKFESPNHFPEVGISAFSFTKLGKTYCR